MIKIPGTPEGVPAIEQAIYEGINVNVTLLFAVEAYETVAEAYLAGSSAARPRGCRWTSTRWRQLLRLPRRHQRRQEARGARAHRSRRARRRWPTPAPPTAASRRSSRGPLGGARAGRRIRAAAAVGLDRDQEPELPRHHVRRGAGRRRTPSTRCRWRRCMRSPTTARSRARPPSWIPTAELEALAEAGIDMDQVTDELLVDGVKQFEDAMNRLLAGIDEQRAAVLTGKPPARSRRSCPGAAGPGRRARQARRSDESVAQRVWRRDASLWGGPGVPEIENRLGWLTVSETMLEHASGAARVRRGVPRRGLHRRRAAGDGRLLARPRGDPPLVRRAFPDGLRLQVLDSTHPDVIAARAGVGRPREDALHRLLEVRRDDRDAVALPALQGAGRARAVRGRHRPRKPARAAGGGRRSAALRSSTRPTSAGATRCCPTSGSCPRR